MEDWVTIRQLRAKHPKMSYREIGRQLGVSHHTVRSALVSEEAPEYERPDRENPALTPFEEVISEMANLKRFRGSRILEEIRSKGYRGGKTAFYALLERVKIESQRHYMPYETAPGQQAQFDWSPYTVTIGGMLTKCTFHSYINGFSRFQVFDVSLSEDQGSVFEAMEGGLAESGGVPGRVQTDNAKVFVTNASTKNFQWNERYLHFCGHYGFEPARSLPMHPWSKGKVEKPFQYLENHFIAGGSFTDFEDLRRKLKAFQERVNARMHSTIKTTPNELIAKDREEFSPLPASGYIGTREEIRKVTMDCLFSFGGSRYSAPWFFAGKQIWVRVSRGVNLEVYSQANKLVARHRLSAAKGLVVIEKTHYREHNRAAGNFESLRQQFMKEFGTHEIFVVKLHAQKRVNAHRHLYQFMELRKLYHRDDMMKVIEICLEYNVFNGSFMAGYLEKHYRQVFDLTAGGPIKRYELGAGGGATEISVIRNLREYQLVLEAPTDNEQQPG